MTDLLERIAEIGERICASNPTSIQIKTKQSSLKPLPLQPPELKPHQTRLRMLHEFAQSAWLLWSANLKA